MVRNIRDLIDVKYEGQVKYEGNNPFQITSMLHMMGARDILPSEDGFTYVIPRGEHAEENREIIEDSYNKIGLANVSHQDLDQKAKAMYKGAGIRA